MSKCESSDTSDEEYVPKVADDSSSESEELDDCRESDQEDMKQAGRGDDAAVPETQMTAEEKEKNEKELWASFKSEVENELVTGTPPTAAVAPVQKPPVGNSNSGKRKCPLSLNSILGTKKPAKISILDQSKRDWDKFVNEEGIKDDLRIFNRGKHGFLERKAFEARTETNQFEIEKSLRLGAANKNKK